MEVKVTRENLSNHDTGGGYREVSVEIFIDETLSPRLQRRTAIYETLGTILDPFEIKGEYIEGLTDVLVDILEQLETYWMEKK